MKLSSISQADRQVILAVGGAVALLVMVVAMVDVPLCGRIGRQLTTLKDLRVKIADAKVLVQQLPEQEAASRASEERYRAMASRVGSGQSVARILETLSLQAKEHHLEYEAVQPPADEEDQRRFTVGPTLALREVPLTLQLAGRYRQLGEFLAELPNAPYLASLKQLTVSRPASDSLKLRADLLLTVYLAEETLVR